MDVVVVVTVVDVVACMRVTPVDDVVVDGAPNLPSKLMSSSSAASWCACNSSDGCGSALV